MRLAQLDGSDEETDDKSEAGHRRIEDPHAAHGECEGFQHDGFLIVGEGFDEVTLGAGEGFSHGRGLFGAQRGSDGRHLLAENVLVNHGTEDDGNCGRGLTEKAEGGRCGGDVGAVDVGLQCDKRSLENRACTNTTDQLVNDDARPRRIILQVNQQTITERQEAHSSHYQLMVTASLFNYQSCNGRDDRQAENHRENVDTTHDGVRKDDGLEVERQVV